MLNLDLGPLTDLFDGFDDWFGQWTPEQFQTNMRLWLNEWVTYVGDRFWGAVGERANGVLAQVTMVNEFTGVLSEIPATWTWENPVVWTLWALMTGCFLAFMGPSLALTFVTFQQRRRKGAPWGDLLDDVFNTVLGVGGALLSVPLSVIGILTVNIMCALVLQESTVLPGMPAFTNADEAARNAGLLAFYAAMGFMLLLERIAATAMVMVCMVFSGWGVGSFFWPHFGRWYGLWRNLTTVSLVSLVVQAVLFRLGGETINRVLSQAPAETREGNFLGMTLGLTCVAMTLLAPILVGGSLAMAGVLRVVSRASRPLGINPAGAVIGAVRRATRGGP